MKLVNWARNAARVASVAALTLALAPASEAGIQVTLSAPGVQATAVAGATTETFNSLPFGSYTNINSSIGTYTAAAPGAMVVAPDAFGGANQTRYIAVGAQSAPTTAVDLTLNGPQAYFGFYWGAVDNQNSFEVYNGNTLLATLTRSSLNSLFQTTGGPFGSGHFGNPNTDANAGEPYAYVNLFATGNDVITRVRFLNNGTGTGFETDNHSVAPVPEPATVTMLGIGGIAMAGFARHRRRRPS